MKKSSLFLFFVLLLAACNNSTSFTGEIRYVSEDYISVECADVVQGSQEPQTDRGIVCRVDITENTIFSGGSREDLSLKTRVEVVLPEEAEINADGQASPIVKAKEIKIRN